MLSDNTGILSYDHKNAYDDIIVSSVAVKPRHIRPSNGVKYMFKSCINTASLPALNWPVLCGSAQLETPQRMAIRLHDNDSENRSSVQRPLLASRGPLPWQQLTEVAMRTLAGAGKRSDDGCHHPDAKFDDGLCHSNPMFNDGLYHVKTTQESITGGEG